MPQIDIDGANSKISADTIQGQSGTTVTVQSGHNLAGSGSGLTALPAGNLTGTVANANLASGIDAAKITTGTLPMARLSGTLPALNGSALTNLPSSFLGSSVGFKAHKDDGNVSLSASTWTKLQMNSQTWDLGDDYDSTSNYRFDVPTTGKYFLLGAANFSGLADQDVVMLSFYRSGTQINAHVVGQSKQHASGTGNLCNSISGYTNLTAGQYIELYAYSDATNIVNSGQCLLAGFQVS